MSATENTTEAMPLTMPTADLLIDLREFGSAITGGLDQLSLPQVSLNETIGSVRQVLVDFQETAFLSCYSIVLVQLWDGEDKEIFASPEEAASKVQLTDMSELSVVLDAVPEDVTISKVAVKLVPGVYDVKSARQHVKRVRETLLKAVLVSGVSKTDEEVVAMQTAAMKKHQEVVAAATVEKFDLSTLAEPLSSAKFFDEALRTANDMTADVEPSPLSKAIKNLFLSGWNPVPSARRLQGDLLYVEAVFATEGTVYVTATAKGFYVNRSNRSTFDPTPASKPCFSHSLFHTLLGASASLRTAFAEMAAKANEWSLAMTLPRALDGVAAVFASYSGEVEALGKHAWLAPAAKAGKYAMHAPVYDMARAQDTIMPLGATDELSAPREWNEEVQAIRNLPAEDLNVQLVKARLEFNIISDFMEAVKRTVAAVADGLVTPLSDADIHVYVLNGVFLSSAEDTRDNYGLCTTEEAARKIMAHDLENQRLIRAVQLDDIGTVLSAAVDFKGRRYIAQSIIPGIFNQSGGMNGAELLYGVLEADQELTVKEKSLALMRVLAEKFHLVERNVKAVPFEKTTAEEKTAHHAGAGCLDPVNKLLLSADEASQSSTIRVNKEDNIEPKDGTLPFIGPIEGKLIQGSDGRTYALEFMRLTPRDANFVAQTQGGTDKLTAEEFAGVDTNVAHAYVLRHELIQLFIDQKVSTARRTLLTEASEKVSKQNEDGSERTEEQITALQEQLTAEYADRLKAITRESLGIKVNPNVFLPVANASEELSADEALTREMSAFLVDTVLPTVTRRVLEGELTPKEPSVMVQYLHLMGINMRYLGRLANLALEEELTDMKMLAQGQHRILSMPSFWHEMLVIEILARASKHALNRKMRSDPNVSAAPAATVATLLNTLVGLLKTAAEETTAPAAAPKEENNSKSSKKNSKNAKKAVVPAVEEPISFQTTVDGFENRADLLATLAAIMKERFLYECPLFAEDIKLADDAAQEEFLAKSAKSGAFLRSRIGFLPLVRRVCQQLGVVLTARSFDFESAEPFRAADIHAIIPRIKSCEPDNYVPEFGAAISSSHNALSKGNYAGSFEFAQQALGIASQVVSQTHEMMYKATESLLSVLLPTSDHEASITTASRALGLAAQLYGLDSDAVIAHHVQVAVVTAEMGNMPMAVQHLLTARYLLSVTSSPRHPDMATILIRLSTIYENMGDLPAAIATLSTAKSLMYDFSKATMINSVIAALYHQTGDHTRAAYLQNSAYLMLKDIYGEEDERVTEAKKSLDTYLAARAAQPATVSEEVEAESKTAPKKGGSKKKSANKKK